MDDHTLAEATYRLARELGIVTEGILTTGSATAVTDTNGLSQAVDYWNDASFWLLRDSAEAGAAPEGEFAIVASFTSSVATLRNVGSPGSSALSAAAASGDRYALGKKRYPLHILIQKVNQALSDLGPIPIPDTTSVDTAAGQTEYPIPPAVKQSLRKVYLQTRVGDSNDNRWEEIHGWDNEPTATGSSGLLVLPMQYPTGRDLKLVYVDIHPELDDASDKISEYVHIDRVTTEAAVLALLWRKQKVGSGDPTLNDQLNFLVDKRDKMKLEYPVHMPMARRKFLVLGKEAPEDEFTYPGPP